MSPCCCVRGRLVWGGIETCRILTASRLSVSVCMRVWGDMAIGYLDWNARWMLVAITAERWAVFVAFTLIHTVNDEVKTLFTVSAPPLIRIFRHIYLYFEVNDADTVREGQKSKKEKRRENSRPSNITKPVRKRELSQKPPTQETICAYIIRHFIWQ